MKTTYVIRDGKLVDKSEAWRLESNQPPVEFIGHFVQRDIPDYLSPIDDSLVSGRRQRRNDLRKNNCRPVEKGERADVERYHREKDKALERKIIERLTWIGA